MKTKIIVVIITFLTMISISFAGKSPEGFFIDLPFGITGYVVLSDTNGDGEWDRYDLYAGGGHVSGGPMSYIGGGSGNNEPFSQEYDGTNYTATAVDKNCGSGLEIYDITITRNSDNFVVTEIDGSCNSTFTFESFTSSNKLATKVTLSNSDFLIYPNPAVDKITLILNQSIPIENYISISLTDLEGKLIRTISSNNINDYHIELTNISNISQGNYFINIETTNNTITKIISIK